MKNLSSLVTNNNSQMNPIFGRIDMIQNNAGGYGFQITLQEQLERFLLIGSEGGTYYVNEKKLTKENAENIIQYIKSNGTKVVTTVVDFVTNNRAPKMDASLFVLALATAFGDQVTKQLAYAAIEKVCRTSTHLFSFVANVQNLRGWSRGLRKAVSKFYLSKDPESLAYQLVKYRNRAGFTHRDVLRLSHPKTKNADQNILFKYAVGKATETETANLLVMSFGAAMKASDNKTLATIIQASKLTWEMIPTEKLNEPEILQALLDDVPLTALIRNLNRFAIAGLTIGNSPTTVKIVSRLTNPELVKKSKLHPMNVVNYLSTYNSGHGFKGKLTWTPNQNIVDALNELYYLSLNNVKPTGKNILVAVDVSGSMCAPVMNSSLSAAQISNILALTILKTEPNVDNVSFDTQVYQSKIGRRTSLDEAIRLKANGGGTDCSMPIAYALSTKNKYDAIIILTDSETWAGPVHGVKLLEQYRKIVNNNVKVVEIAMSATPHTTLPSDKNLLRVVGFDQSVVDLISKFLN